MAQFCLCPFEHRLRPLSAGARLDGHVGVDLEHQVGGLVLVKDDQWAHLLRDAAGLGYPGDDAHGSDDALDGGVVGGLGHLKEWRGRD